MKLRSLLYPFLFPAWEFLLMVLLPSEYYVGATCIQKHPYPICTFHFAPSLVFVILVMAPFVISILLGLLKKWSEFIAFGTSSLAVILVTLLLLYLFEKSPVPPIGAGITSVMVILYIGVSRGKTTPQKAGEKWIWVTMSLIASIILCIMVWNGISVKV